MIELRNVSKVINKRKVLEDISLNIDKNSVYGIYGPNGSGKTMLFRVMSGLVKQTEGDVLIDGRKLHEDISFPRSLGLTIENGGFWEYYTGFENLKILSSIKNKIDDDKIRQTLKRVGLDSYDDRLYKEYSLGMRQRLAIAQAIMEAPEIILLDEPTGALDEEGTILVRNIIMEEKKRGATILIASHSKEDLGFVDGRVQIQEGKIIGRFQRSYGDA